MNDEATIYFLDKIIKLFGLENPYGAQVDYNDNKAYKYYAKISVYLNAFFLKRIKKLCKDVSFYLPVIEQTSHVNTIDNYIEHHFFLKHDSSAVELNRETKVSI